MKRAIILLLAAALAFFPPIAMAQPYPGPPPTSFQPAASGVSLSVTGTTARVALSASPATFPVVTIVNNGGAEIFCKLGDATVVASTSAYTFTIYPGGYRATWDSTSAYVACITATSTATARISQSNGAPQIGMLGWPPAAGVGSFNGRTGLVVPEAADYAAYYCELDGCAMTGPITYSSDPPVVSACGTSPALATGSTDWVGEVAEGAVATGCVVTFAATLTGPPFCVVTAQTHLAAFDYSVSPTALTIVNTSTSGEVFNWACHPRPA